MEGFIASNERVLVQTMHVRCGISFTARSNSKPCSSTSCHIAQLCLFSFSFVLYLYHHGLIVLSLLVNLK